MKCTLTFTRPKEQVIVLMKRKHSSEQHKHKTHDQSQNRQPFHGTSVKDEGIPESHGVGEGHFSWPNNALCITMGIYCSFGVAVVVHKS